MSDLTLWVVFGILLLGLRSIISPKHKHIYHTVHSEFQDPIYVYHRHEYDFCIRCGEKKIENLPVDFTVEQGTR